MRELLALLGRRYRLAVPLSILAIACAFPVHQFVKADSPIAQAPSNVIVTEATPFPQGVRVSWLPSMPGDNPIAGYSIERSRAQEPFQKVGWVEGAVNFIDGDGQKNDAYRVRAKDTGQIPLFSDVTQSVVARGSERTAYTQGYGSRDAIPFSEGMAQLQPLLASHNMDALAPMLADLVTSVQQIMSVPDADHSAARVCAEQTETMALIVRIVPEALRMDARILQASCYTLQKGADQ